MSVFLRKVKTENGWVEGIPAADPRVTSFKGVPFAKPPVGDLRWHAPMPADNWDGVLACKEFAPISMQPAPGAIPTIIYTKEWNVDPEIAMSEDCLYLNIWTPAKTGNEKLPVYVWYFGGGLREGNTAEMEFDGERIARRGVVFVSVNYRVNSFGFLAHPELTAENPEAPTNFGHLDQQFGTQWVKRNIAAFGGDPDNITIGGQSAGGMSVSAQVACPANEGLFQRAIIESGYFDTLYMDPKTSHPRTLAEAEENGKRFFEFLGVKTLAEARAIDAETLRDKTAEYNDRFNTTIDGKFQPVSYRDAFADGSRLQIPLMMGWTNNEFFDGPEANDLESLKAELETKLGAECAEKLLALTKPCKDFAAAKKALAMRRPELGVRAYARQDEAVRKQPLYVYEFGADIPGDNMGAFHSIDLWFWFETLAKCWRPFAGKHYDLARHMCNYLVNFVKTGDPNGFDADGQRMPEWLTYTDKNPRVMGFYDKAGMAQETMCPLMDAAVDGIVRRNG